MNRLQKKCLLASVATHALLILILFVGPAFLSSHQAVDDLPVLEVLPSKLIDDLASGGGSPAAKPPPPAPQEPVVKPPAPEPVKPPAPEPVRQPAPEPVKIKPVALEPVHHERVVKEEKIKEEKISKDSLEPVARPAAKKPVQPHKVEINQDELVQRKAGPRPKKPAVDAEAEAQARENARSLAERRMAMNNALRSLKEGLSSPTTVEMPGPGGEAYANYAQAVKSVYEQAWIAPEDVSDDNGTTRASVTIARDGNVISAHIIGMSGTPAVDRSVGRTLERVKFVAPFPEGAKESQRTFIISFNLKAKRLLG